MIETKITDTKLVPVDYSSTDAPSLYKIMKGLNEAIMQRAVLMSIILNTLSDTNKMMGKLNDQMQASGLAKESAAKEMGVVSAILLAVSFVAIGTLPFYREIAEGAQPTAMQTVHGMMRGMGMKALLTAPIPLRATQAYYSLKKGRASSDSMNIEAEMAQLSPVTDSNQSVMDDNSQAIDSMMRAEKTEIENINSSETKKLYYKK